MPRDTTIKFLKANTNRKILKTAKKKPQKQKTNTYRRTTIRLAALFIRKSSYTQAMFLYFIRIVINLK